MKLRVVPYKKGSQSAKLIAKGLTKALGYKVWRGPPKTSALNISWGNHEGTLKPVIWVNGPIDIHTASNKLSTFKKLEAAGVSHVPYTTSKESAQNWSKDGYTVFARTVNGQGGSGITVVEGGTSQVLPDMPLYTQYVKKKKEFRVHVVGGEAIDVQQKKKKTGSEVTTLIWNHDHDYVFCHNDVEEPEELRKLGVAAVAAVGLDFGAVDIIWNQYHDKCFVLEVNSAPGLCETTCGKYVQAFVSKYSQTPPVSTHLQAKVQ